MMNMMHLWRRVITTCYSFFLLWIFTLPAELNAQANDTIIVPFGSDWRYLNWLGGVIDSVPDNDPNFEANWFKPDYDDTTPIAWDGPSPGPLSNGDIPPAWSGGFGECSLS